MSRQESNPSQATKAAWQVGSSPVGSAAGKGVSGAAKASLALGQEAVKVLQAAHSCSSSRFLTHFTSHAAAVANMRVSKNQR